MKLETTPLLRTYGSNVFGFLGIEYQSKGPWVGPIADFTFQAAVDFLKVRDQALDDLTAGQSL